METIFNEVILGIFQGGCHFEKTIEILTNENVDIYYHDNQIVRELKHGRLCTVDTLKIYKILVEKYNYVLTSSDIQSMIDHKKIVFK